MFQSVGSRPDTVEINPRIRIRTVGRGEAGLYASVSARGWSESPEVQGFIDGFARVSVEYATCLVAEIDGVAIATAALFMKDGVGLLAGASTVPEGRRQGAQAALLDWRLKHLAAHGCDLAMMAAAPGSASQRNAERNGFRIAYTRTKWQR
jgi:GNAT superfamily N-acetyltransferase